MRGMASYTPGIALYIAGEVSMRIMFHGILPGQDLDLVMQIDRLLEGAPYRDNISYENAGGPRPQTPYIEIMMSSGFLSTTDLLLRIRKTGYMVSFTVVQPDGRFTATDAALGRMS